MCNAGTEEDPFVLQSSFNSEGVIHLTMEDERTAAGLCFRPAITTLLEIQQEM